ncbi:MAG: hypothetical protein UT55_C0037G0009 [Candidatus Peregrinibacteria bacterium GW2011_GWE2_39_6]|nr:MAG: hypothetical protein UT36_C0003G0056 [Candidatus Peregrinibacteria bacterium GW2011_GWF2_39_17]KKR25590.1 MAG: hypothetical protein UT55_C0037G0009 [Candidatus Peregrinibacteria bacterium GW2011_GWE2_39_6]
MKLTQKQRDQLWAEQWPYSEARISDEKSARNTEIFKSNHYQNAQVRYGFA